MFMLVAQVFWLFHFPGEYNNGDLQVTDIIIIIIIWYSVVVLPNTDTM